MVWQIFSYVFYHPYTRLISISPVMERGDLRIIMNWNKDPRDLDLHSVQIDTETRATCRTFFRRKDSCTGVFLDLDYTKA